MGLAAAGTVLATPGIVKAATPLPTRRPAVPHKIGLINMHTGERLTDLVFGEGDVFFANALEEINKLLRDHRTDEVAQFDPELLKLLASLHSLTGSGQEFHVVSGYRSPATNNMLRRLGRGAAKNSYHTHAMAVDIRLPDVQLSTLRRAAVSLKRGGIGYYPRSNFLHVDTGRFRTW